MDFTSTLTQALALSVEERLRLVEAILDSIELSEEQKQLFDRRIADLEANPDNVLTWEQIKSHVRDGR